MSLIPPGAELGLQTAAGRSAASGDMLLAGKEALEQRDATDAERARQLRAAWDEGMESRRRHGPQLESDDELEAFTDEADALRQQ